MRTLLSLTLLCASAAGAPVPKELKNCERIVGLWKLESATIHGRPAKVGADDTDWRIDEKSEPTRSGNDEVASFRVCRRNSNSAQR